ncbi:MAG TPA: ATP-binding protein [Longimicrobiales bacterium]|nr:ATP-binding protein [Longimicrobiales bacterium]
MIDPTVASRLFARVAEVSTDAIISVDSEQRIVYFNRGAEQIFRWSREEIVGRPLGDLLPERFRGAHARHLVEFGLSDVTARVMGERLPIAGLRRDGTEFPAEASITKLVVGDDIIYTAVLRDVTDRRRAQEIQHFLARVGSSLVASIDLEETLQTVAHLAVPVLGDWATVWTGDEEETRRLALAVANPEHAELADRLRRIQRTLSPEHPAKEALAGGTSVLVMHADDELLDRIASDESHRRVIRALGFRSAMFVPMRARDRALGVICHYAGPARPPFGEEDLALAEELARRAALAVDNARLYRAAQEAISAREDVMRIVSHDIGNPLSAVFVATRVLRRFLEAEEIDRAAIAGHVDGIRQSAEQVQRLIDDLLDVERIGAGRLRLQIEPVPAGTLVRDAVAFFGATAAEQGVSLVATGADLAARVAIDPDRIAQVLANLVTNALKHTAAGGRVTVSAEARDAHVEFAVADTGSGVDPAELPFVFERFWQGRGALGRGAGLGLPIARGIVEAHGGTISAESSPGVGSVFRFILPIAKDKASQPSG